jgi:hypothetical protein
MTSTSDVAMARALELGALPEAGFHHADHLRVGCVYLDESGTVDEALRRIAATLKRFAASVGKAVKYSDSVTAFWMHQLAAARAVLPDADPDELFRAFPRLLDKTLATPRDSAATRSADSSA